MTDLSLPTNSHRRGYAAQRQRSPGALAAAIAINGGVFALILALPATQYIIDKGPRMETRWVTLDPVPPETKPDPVRKDKPLPTQKATETAKTDPLPFTPPFPTFETDNFVKGTGDTGTGAIGPIVEPPPLPVHKPVFRGAQQDPRYADAFHPDYPPSLQREGLEGSVTVRVTIDQKGRVIAVEMVKATNRAFFDETREQALRHWRFLPATSDGAPVQSQQTLTVNFQLET